jgi:superfamily I DNA/RNA helicase
MAEIQKLLLEGLTPNRTKAVRSEKNRLLVVAGAGSGKTEVMARRVAWRIGVDEVPKDKIIYYFDFFNSSSILFSISANILLICLTFRLHLSMKR